MADLEGFKELSRQLKELGRTVGGNALRSAANAALMPALRKARQTVPVGTVAHKTYKGRLVAPGFLRRSLKRSTKLGRNRNIVFARLGVKEEAFYGVVFLERGTSKIQKRPWLVPAFESTKDESLKLLSERLKKRIEAAAKK